MLITVDTSAVMAVLLEEENKKTIVAKTNGLHLQAPPSIFWEVGNALSSLLRRDLISIYEATEALETFDSIPIRLAQVDLAPSIELANRHKIYAYDAYVIECARKYHTPLLSLDRAQCRVARSEGVEIIEMKS
jgi:predicted nucleic acid-binding protein